MIEVNGVTKTFDDFTALDGLTMTVKDGSIYGLVGPNGAGKTTIINHINGVYRPDRGSVRVDGQEVFDQPEVKKLIATIPSDFYYFTQSRISDLRDLYASVFPAFDRELFDKLEKVFEIDTHRMVRSLSKGMQKQVAFWLTLSQRPKYMLLDEPADGLDPANRRKVWSLVMKYVAEEGMTVLTSSHNLRELSDVCDYVGIMKQGHMFMERSLSELQGDFVKVQVALPDGVDMPTNLTVINRAEQGRLITLVIKGNAEQVTQVFTPLNPVLFNIYPLSLEEIFIYELGGDNDGIKEIFA